MFEEVELRRFGRAIFCLGSAIFLLTCLLPVDAQSLSNTSGSQMASSSGGATEDDTVQLSLQDAIQRAKILSPTLETALTNAKIAAENTVQARAATLPSVTGNSQYLYTEGNGTPSARFIANNGVHEYIAQTDVHQAISGPLFGQYRRSVLLEAVARDEAEIARRGVIVSVVQSYASLIAADGKATSLAETLDAAQDFLKTTEELEKGGEVAHADVIKARIQVADNQAAFNDAQVTQEQARLALALLVFPDVNQKFRLDDDPGQILELPAFNQAQLLAEHDNPEIDAAERTRRAAQKDVAAAWMEYLPSLTFDYFYGIDANQFATETTTPRGRKIQNLGYSALASLNVPIFNWGATHSKVKQAEYGAQQATTALDYAKRKLNADLQQYYREAQTAREEMDLRKKAAQDAEESRRLVLLQYRAGVATSLEVVSAESTVTTERSAYYDAETRYATAIATLATLTGAL